MAVRNYRDLIVWQLADAFKKNVFALILASPQAARDYRFRGQLQDSASAVSKDIAEGFRRFSPAVFAQFLDYALGSLQEAEERVRDGIDLKYFPATDCDEALRLAKRCTVALMRLKHSQQKRPKEPRPQNRRT
jgi:four helix bundle protein